MVGTPAAGANRAAPPLQLRPLAIPIDKDAALVENAIEKQRSAGLNPLKTSDVHSPSGHILKARAQARTSRVAGERYEQIQIGALVLVATCQRAVEDSQPNPPLDAERAAKSGQELPVSAKVLVLPRLQAQPAWTGAPGADGPLRHGATKRALVGAEIVCKLLERSHADIITLYVRYKPNLGFTTPRYPYFMRLRSSRDSR